MLKPKTHRITGFVVRGLAALLLLAFIAAAFPMPAAAQTCAANYTVKSGDTLTKIAFDYDVNWLDLAAANNLKDPYTLFVGQVLCIPGSASSSSSSSSSSTSTSSSTKRTFNVTFIDSDKRITFDIQNFPGKVSYYARIRDGVRWRTSWHKFGVFYIGKEGDKTVTFKLPDAYRDLKSFTVCLKNAENDKVYCKYYRDIPR